jgi:hypothetical protein
VNLYASSMFQTTKQPELRFRVVLSREPSDPQLELG